VRVVAVIAASLELTVAILGIVRLWQRRRRGLPASSVLVAVAAGAAGSLAMVPAGLLVQLVPGAAVNVYGEWLADQVFGSTMPAALLAVHLVVGWLAAPPLLVAFALGSRRGIRLGRGPRLGAGASYGAAMWLVVNSWALPLLTGREWPWSRGWIAIWPSLAVHLVYGVTVAWMGGPPGRSPRVVAGGGDAAVVSPTG
jgi:hypothetical protein